MSDPSTPEPSLVSPAVVAATDAADPATTGTATPSSSAPGKDSYVKLAMRNMVRKRGTSLQHFALTTVGLLGLLVGLSYLTR